MFVTLYTQAPKLLISAYSIITDASKCTQTLPIHFTTVYEIFDIK